MGMYMWDRCMMGHCVRDHIYVRGLLWDQLLWSQLLWDQKLQLVWTELQFLCPPPLGSHWNQHTLITSSQELISTGSHWVLVWLQLIRLIETSWLINMFSTNGTNERELLQFLEPWTLLKNFKIYYEREPVYFHLHELNFELVHFKWELAQHWVKL